MRVDPPHQHHFVDLFRRNAGVGDGLFARACRALQNRLDQQLENRTRNLALIAVAVGQLDVEAGRGLRGKLDLRFDGSLAHGLYRAGMGAQIDAVLGINLVQRNSQQQVVDVVAAQVRIAVGGLHLEDAVFQLEDGNVEGAAAQIVHGNGPYLGAVQPVSQCRRGGLVHQPQNFQPGHAPRIFVAWRCASLKYAGTVITACVTCSPKNRSALRLSCRST